MAVKVKSGNDSLDDTEFYLGRIEPGATRSYMRKVLLPDGYPSSEATVDLSMVTPQGVVVAKGATTVRSASVNGVSTCT